MLDPDLDLGSDVDTIPDDTLNRTHISTDANSLTSLSGDEDLIYNETGPMRDDMPIKTGRWEEEEVDALMNAININREAIKFNFQGPGGGKDVKRQGWLDVVGKQMDGEREHRKMMEFLCPVKETTIVTLTRYMK